MTSGNASAQISPGPLTRAHQNLEGATQCTTCHNFGLGARGFKCLDCHTEIQKRVDLKHGYHARAYNSARGQTDCARCHLEHNGRQYPITKLDRANFSHDGLTDFKLVGKHQTLACENCHNPAKIEASVKSEIKITDLTKTYLGLETGCTSCHKDQHAGQLGAQCLNCHSQDAWKPAAGFRHDRTVYPLTGRHQALTCDKCHRTPAGSDVVRYKGLSFSSCEGCHNDPHKGAFQSASFKGACDTCHVTSNWKAVRSDTGFDHQQTKFPLHGKHAELTCFKCHKNSEFTQPIAHELCANCHEDVHRGQFQGRAAGSDCSACHSETSFKPALFTREQHQKSAFPLQGKHAPMDCARCHKPEGRDAKYMLGTLTCVACHADPHAGEFQGEPYANRCESCHSQNTFHPSNFDLPRHSKTRFTLTGAHVAVVCADCHKPVANAASVAARQYHFTSQTCTACHSDPHRISNQVRTGETCETCHNTRQWKEVRSFNHNATKFALEGAHQQVPCIGCHQPAKSTAASKAKPVADFSATPTQCSGCHEDIHGGQFLTGGAEKDCFTCHTVTKWNLGSFDHDKTQFPLSGSHPKARCAQCHTQQMERDGKQIRSYRGTPTRCSSCHADGTPIASVWKPSKPLD